MTRALLVVGTRRLGSDAFNAAVGRLSSAGAEVDVITFWPPERAVTGLARLVSVGPMTQDPSLAIGDALGPSRALETGEPDAREPRVHPSEQLMSAPPVTPTGIGPARVKAALEWRKRRLRRALRRRLAPMSRRAGIHRYRMWWRTRRRPEALALASSADVVVAFDSAALLTVWRLSRRTTAPAVNGVSAGVRALSQALTDPISPCR